MEAKINFDNFYNKLTDGEKQVCDLCRDWNLGGCEKCEFVSRFASNIEQEEINDNSRKMVRQRKRTRY